MPILLLLLSFNSRRIGMPDFQPEMMWDDDKIIIKAKEVNKGRASGKEINLSITQIFKIRYGQIVSFEEYTDTATMATLFE